MSQARCSDPDSEQPSPPADRRAAEAWAEMVGPLLAGARARGVADALDLVGMAAILIDSTGCVLHASSRAVRAISPLIRIVEDHLVGDDPATNDTLQTLLADAVRRDGSRPTARFLDQEGRVRLFVRVLEFPAGLAEQPQLLSSILIVNDIGF